MANYLDLPVYKASYDLLLKIFCLTKSFPREYKYSIGQDLRHIMIDLIKNIYLANSANNKMEIIGDCRIKVETIRLYLRLLFDLKIISLDKFIDVVEINESISKQLVNWQKYYKRPELSTTTV